MDERTILLDKELGMAVEDIVVGGSRLFADLQPRLISLPIGLEYWVCTLQ
jgi:hypothetical protein